MDNLPSQTLYINNLNEKIDKKTLKKTIYMLVPFEIHMLPVLLII